jgi:Cys-tRNA(Pro)/Cys-tRNA(Cys) deacylase
MGGEERALAAIEASGIAHRVVRHGQVGSLDEAAAVRGLEPSQLLKTIVVRRTDDDFLFVLVPGDREISWPKLRALLGVSRLSMPDAEVAREVTGYERGTITPFGAKAALPVIVDAAGTRPDVVAVGGGAHGVNVHLSPANLIAATGATVADISVVDPPHQHD